MIYFLDLEASSLLPGSFPIEIAWVEAISGRSESYLISPATQWRMKVDTLWSADSERIHGIGYSTLELDGTPHEEVARRAEKVLGQPGQMIVSDAPSWDGAWLARLLTAADLRVQIRLVGFHELYGLTCKHAIDTHVSRGPDEATLRPLSERALSMINETKRVEAAKNRVRHRALPDAQAMQSTWKAASDAFEAYVRAANRLPDNPDIQQSRLL